MATKFTYKMRSGGKWDVGSGTRPTQTNLFKKKKICILVQQTDLGPVVPACRGWGDGESIHSTMWGTSWVSVVCNHNVACILWREKK
jgi:hypothetical protein